MINITIRVSQIPHKYGVGPWQRKISRAALPRIGDTVFVDDYSWGDHIRFEGVEVKSVGHSLLTGEIIVDVEDIEERGELHSVDGTTWTEKASKYWEEGDDENGRERVVLIGFTLCDS
jgi:hypothetical protein